MKSKRLKTATVNQDPKLTDFFARKPGGNGPSSSPQMRLLPNPTLEAGQSSKTTKSNNRPLRPDREVISVPSDSHISVSSDSVVCFTKSIKSRPRSSSRAADIACRKRAGDKPRSQHLAVPSPISAKAPHLSMGPSQRLPKRSSDKLRLSAKRKSKFDSDSDVEMLDTVVYVPKTTKSKQVTATPITHSLPSAPLRPKENLTSRHQVGATPYKKARISLPEPPAVEVGELVPSSQSDELELTLPKRVGRNVGEVVETVRRWREGTATAPDDFLSPQDDLPVLDINMDIDAELPHPNPEISLVAQSTEIISSDRSEDISPWSALPCPDAPPVHEFEPLTPPRPSELHALPATPIALDVESKTAQIIAQIKANAYVDSVSSPENQPLPEFNDLVESSDEDDFNLPVWKPSRRVVAERTPNKDVPFTSPLTSIPSSCSGDELALSPSHFSHKLRSRRAFNLDSSGLSRSIGTSKRADVVPNGSGKSKSKRAPRRRMDDPLGKLLHEKQRAEKSGKGAEALRLAENAVGTAQNRLDWTDETAAFSAVQEGYRLGFESSCSPFGTPSASASDSLPEAEDQERLLGSERGKAVSELLAGDRVKKERGRAEGKALGVSLWKEGKEIVDEAITDSHHLPSLSETGKHPIIKVINTAIECGDLLRAKLLLNSGVLAMPVSEWAGVIPDLCDLALSIPIHPLAESAFYVLSHLFNSRHYIQGDISLNFVLSTLLRLGAKPSALCGMGWTAGPKVRDENVEVQTRVTIVYRLVSLLTTAARAGAVSQPEVPDLVMVLQLLAIDPSATIDSKRECMVAIDAICQTVTQDVNSLNTEVQICDKLLKFTSQLTPANKALFISFLAGGSPQTLRIARWIAYGLLVQEYVICLEEYTRLPPLSNLIDLLLLSLESNGLFSIHDATDYEDLGHYVDILGVALSDIDGYVAEEHNIPQTESSVSQDRGGNSPRKGEKDKPVQLVQRYLDRIHAKIVDTRAAHLDRSRTKAALQRLSLRIFYQRLAALKSGEGSGRPRNLLNWIKK